MTYGDLRRSMGWLLALCVAFNAAQYTFAILPVLLWGTANAMMIFEYARNFNYMGWLAPMLAAVPYCVSFCVDWKSGFAIPQLTRVGSRKFIRSKLVAVGVSGGAVFALGTLLFFFVCRAFLSLEGYLKLFDTAYPMYDALEVSIALYMAGLLCIQFLGGVAYALMSLAFSAYHPNAYFALIFPLLINKFSTFLSARLALPSYMNISMLADGATELGFLPSLLAAFCVFGALIALCCAAFSLGVRRRIENG